MVIFQELVKADNIGIVPGFGRDETIYLQNNRVKELEISFATDGGFGDAKTVELADGYKMHFVDLDGAEFNKIKFTIKDIHKGSKYNDTCISEVDFWSDFVKSEDEEAAMNYYVKYKKDFALTPYDIIGKVVFSDAAEDKCQNPGKPQARNGYLTFTDEGDYAFYGLPIYVSAYVNEYGKEGDEVTLKWYSEILDFEGVGGDQGPKSIGWDLKGEEEEKVVKSCDGKLFVHSEGVGIAGPSLGSNKVEIYHRGKLVGKGEFALTQ